MNYRKEIDGLRGIAVLAVIFYHAGINSFFSGGYVGVDVFFVISGYLITSIILTEKKSGTFTFIDFYNRRARRILPALYFVMLCSIPIAFYSMDSEQLKAFSSSLIVIDSSSSFKNSTVLSDADMLIKIASCSVSLKYLNIKARSDGCVFSINFIILVFAWRLNSLRNVSRRIVISELYISFLMIYPPFQIVRSLNHTKKQPRLAQVKTD